MKLDRMASRKCVDDRRDKTALGRSKPIDDAIPAADSVPIEDGDDPPPPKVDIKILATSW
jgi:hypothetical protein